MIRNQENGKLRVAEELHCSALNGAVANYISRANANRDYNVALPIVNSVSHNIIAGSR